jgi:hypothetical protein
MTSHRQTPDDRRNRQEKKAYPKKSAVGSTEHEKLTLRFGNKKQLRLEFSRKSFDSLAQKPVS